MKEQISGRIIFAQNLSRLMAQHNKTRQDVCRDLGIKYMTLSDWLNAKTYPRIDTMEKIAAYFGVTKSTLVEQWHSQTDGALEAKAVRIPVLGRVAAGIPLMAAENVIDWEEIPAEMARDGEYFALYIYGDSMEPRMCKGDLIIIRKQSDADDGDIVIALINGQDACCKRLKKYEDGTIALVSTNPAYKPLYFTPEEQRQTPVEVVGKVKELRGRL